MTGRPTVVLAAAAVAGALALTASAAPRPTAQTPGAALVAFVEAARDGRIEAMWVQLTPGSRARLGPSLASFRDKAGRRLRDRLRGFGPGVRLIVDERIDGRVGLAAVAGLRRTPRGRRYDAYAAAALRDGRRWRLELRGPVRLHTIRPDPGERVIRRTQIAAGVVTHAPIVEAGLWFDGVAFPSRGGMTDPRHLTMWDEAPQPLLAGDHIVVAFASAGRTATAIAWTFFVVPTA